MTIADKAVNTDERYNIVADQKLNAIADKAINADKRRDSIVGK